MSVLIVSAADESYADMLLEQIASLQAIAGFDYHLATVDLGLAPATRARVETLVNHVVTPSWPFKPHPVFGAEPRYLSRAIRPFLSRYFPGYETYVWLDADCWVQQGPALANLVLAAATGLLAVVPSLDRSYVHGPTSRQWVYERYRMGLGEAEAQSLMLSSYVNSGVFALRGDAPHWRAWEARFQRALDQWEGTFLSDQAVLNALIYTDKAPVSLLPAEYNWICGLALPMWSLKSNCFVNPHFPWSPLGLVHNTFNDKRQVVPVPLKDGRILPTQLTYSAYTALRGGLAEA